MCLSDPLISGNYRILNKWKMHREFHQSLSVSLCCSHISRLIPRWLASIAPALVKAGKCAEILKANGVLTTKNHTHPNLFAQEFVEQFSMHLQQNFHLQSTSWNPLTAIHHRERNDTTKPLSHPFLSLSSSFDDIDNEKNAFLSSAFNQMLTPKSTLLEKNR